MEKITVIDLVKKKGREKIVMEHPMTMLLQDLLIKLVLTQYLLVIVLEW